MKIAGCKKHSYITEQIVYALPKTKYINPNQSRDVLLRYPGDGIWTLKKATLAKGLDS